MPDYAAERDEIMNRWAQPRQQGADWKQILGAIAMNMSNPGAGTTALINQRANADKLAVTRDAARLEVLQKLAEMENAQAQTAKLNEALTGWAEGTRSRMQSQPMPVDAATGLPTGDETSGMGYQPAALLSMLETPGLLADQHAGKNINDFLGMLRFQGGAGGQYTYGPGGETSRVAPSKLGEGELAIGLPEAGGMPFKNPKTFAPDRPPQLNALQQKRLDRAIAIEGMMTKLPEGDPGREVLSRELNSLLGASGGVTVNTGMTPYQQFGVESKIEAEIAEEQESADQARRMLEKNPDDPYARRKLDTSMNRIMELKRLRSRHVPSGVGAEEGTQPTTNPEKERFIQEATKNGYSREEASAYWDRQQGSR